MLLPHKLIIQILLRLPVKSLIRFKSVCKLWFSLISHDPHFANSHFQLNSATHTRRILLMSTSTHQSRSIDFETSLDDDNASFSLNLPEGFRGLEITGSCRGFLLFCSSLSIYLWNPYLWNPSTGVHKHIPLSPFGFNLDAEYFYGFGYDDSTEDYLVVSMSRIDSGDPPLRLEYFSLKSNTWKEVEGPHFPYVFQEDEPKGGLLYKGAIHWVAYRYDLQTDVIVVFDLMERKLSYMLLPTDSDGSRLECGLWVYGEFLSVYTKYYTNDMVQIWVMKEYKVNSSWTMALALPSDPFFPLCCTKSDDIIGTDGEDGLVKYDKSGQCLEQHSYPNYYLRCNLTMYIDSLLSLPGGYGDNQQA
ncbi:F-box/kelch-repeat protein At3g06240-like [Vicia villosa]|uniref:F-box/kelch-repeat protein At3g06240-like n=1 Tax=Vicia villosa TaxID=3911 RepID=UPI00273BA247|nr:F-box/kelch-repeat protein At3g06240-like [Vicia villosa]